jgi:hypothetical protein
MATSDILGLFATPEQYQAQQRAQDQSAALQYAGMTPIQQANYGIFSGAQQLGRGVSGLLGVQDPQLQRIRQRQEIMQTINPADPDSLRSGIQRAAEGNDSELALSLTEFLNRQMSEMAQAQQRLAAAGRERQQAIPADIAKARELGVLTTALAELEKTPVGTPGRDQQMTMLRAQISALERPEKVTPDMANAAALADLSNVDRNSAEWKTAYQTQLTRLTTKPENTRRTEFAQALVESGLEEGSPEFKEKMAAYTTKKLADTEEKVSFGVDREALAAEMFNNRRFKDLTPAEKAKVNARKEAEDSKNASLTAPKLVLPGQKEPVDISKFRKEFKDSLRPYGEVIDAGDVGITLMNDAINTGNFASFESARTNLAKMVDPGRLTNADIERAGVDPAVVSRARDLISRVFTSTPSKQTMDSMLSTMKLMRKVARAKYNRELETQRKLAKQSNIPDESIETLFEDVRRPEQKPAGNSKAVDFNALPK